ncbi:MAG: catalase [Candidatus Dormibacteria bacterium]
MEFAPDLAERLVAALHSVHGEHPGHRAAHAKGSCARAVFSATADAATLTRAVHMRGEPVPATVRFSNGSGIPALPDYARGDGRGIAVKFDLPDGTHTDMVGLTLPVFFVRDPESFIEFLTVTRPDPETRQPDLGLIGAFLERHPETRNALDAALSGQLPASYLQTRYNGLHAFRLTNPAGESRWARYRWEPELGEQSITVDKAREGGREYLQDELRTRLAAGSAALRLIFILAGEGDSLTDPTASWPADRPSVVAGRLEITSLEPAETCDRLVFDPTNVADGIECSHDAILHARSVAYARSFAARRGIRPPGAPAAVAPPADLGPRALLRAGELQAGGLAAIDVDGTRVAVARVGGILYAFQDACTHRGCSLAEGTLGGGTVTCPCHGSEFDVTTGAVVRGPAAEALATYGQALPHGAP